MNKYWTSEDTVGIHKINEDNNVNYDDNNDNMKPVLPVESMKRNNNINNRDKLHSFDVNDNNNDNDVQILIRNNQ